MQTKGRQPPTLPSPATIKKLPRESLLLHLNNCNLSTKGSKPMLAARLFNHVTLRRAPRPSTRKHATPVPDQEEGNGEPTASSTESQSHSESPLESPSGDSQSSSDDPEPTTKQSARKRKASQRSRLEHHHHHKRHKRDLSSDNRRRRRSRSTSSASSDVSTSSSSPSTTVSSDSSSERSRSSHRRHKRHRRHHRRSTRHRHDYWHDPSLQSSVACAPPLPRHIQDRIHRGKYVSFNKLLLPKGTIPISHAPRESRKSKRKNRREVEDSATWLEAWNRYLCARIAFSPSTALELVKYQTLMVMFFTHHQAEQCINYDDLFRQAAARDPTLRWDAIKEDIYVWAFSKQHQKPSSSFREKLPITSRLGPPTYATTKLPTDRVTHTTAGKEICKRFNSSKCTRGDDCVFAHVCWHQHCQGPHPGKGCTKKP